mgnify:CR=1 FL=1
MNKVAIITGVAGQDGSYLAEFLLEKNYKVVGVTRRKSVNKGLENLTKPLEHENFELVYGDITDSSLISKLLMKWQPQEYYNLAAMSHVGQSFKEPISTFRVDGEAVIMQLDLIKQLSPDTRFYQASTSELFGGVNCPPEGLNETSRFHPRSPYAIAKAAAFYAVVNYREAYGMHASNGILFNHSSPRRGTDFATRKITRGIAEVVLGLDDRLRMGNLEAFRDEGHAKDYVEAQWMMLQQPIADDYVIATGEATTIKDMFKYVCEELGGLDFEQVYKEDQRFMRPSEVNFLRGDASKAERVLGWKPKYSCKELLKEMYENDLKDIAHGK